MWAATGSALADSVYLPRADRPAPAEPCSSPESGAWTVRCGGFGRIRDLYALADGGVWAVGDGTALLSGDRWSVQIGEDLFGLEALSLDEATEQRGWAVGEADVIAELFDGRWRRYRPGEGNPGVDLAAVSVHTESWAGGRDGDHAALRVLRVDPAEDPLWIDVPDQAAQLPPIDDIFTAAPLSRPGAWAVGTSGTGAGAFMKHDDLWRVAQATVGRPQELAMSGMDSGWAFGSFPLETGDALAFWQLSPQNGDTWLEQNELRLPGRTLLDAYKAPDRPGYGPYTVYVGMEPSDPAQSGSVAIATADDKTLVLGHATEDDSWRPVAVGGAELGEDLDDVQSRAIAPLPGGDVIYAWSGGVWRVGGEDGGWQQVRRRRALSGLMADTDSAWVLDEASGQILSSTSAGMTPFQGVPAGQLSAGEPGDAWLVDAGGATTRVTGPMGRTLAGPAVPQARQVTALDASANRLVAAGIAQDGRLAVWAWSDTAWLAAASIDDPEPLTVTGIAAGEAGWTWVTAATAHGAPLPNAPFAWGASVRDSGGERASHFYQNACPSTFHGRVVALPPSCATGPCVPLVWCFEPPMTDVTAAEADGAWAAGGHLLVRCRAGSCRQEGSSPAPFGTRFAALAAGAGDDVWAALVRGVRGRGRSILVHFDGAGWSEKCRFEVAIADMTVASEGTDRSLWLAGDWSTLMRHAYGPGEHHACAGS